MPNAVKEIPCRAAEDFLSALDRGNPLWEGKMQFWAFRGHSDDSYKLIPTALRAAPDMAQLGYTHNIKVGVQTTNKKQIDAEFQRIHEFYWLTDSQGLNIPGDSYLLRTPAGWRELKKKIQADGWPLDDLLPLLAIAQHYSVPTRLLDWSDSPLVAAFFAARKTAEKPTGSHLSVWALNLDWIINEAFPGGSSKTIKKMPVYIITAPRATNPNLHAQGGVFTTENLVKNDFYRKVSVRSVNTLVEKKWKATKSAKPVMVHITLPVGEASKLIRLLNQVQINSATLFPGYQGVAEALYERKYWDKRKKATYWL